MVDARALVERRDEPPLHGLRDDLTAVVAEAQHGCPLARAHVLALGRIVLRLVYPGGGMRRGAGMRRATAGVGTAGGTGGRGRGAPAATTAMSRGIRMIHCAAYVAGAEARP